MENVKDWNDVLDEVKMDDEYKRDFPVDTENLIMGEDDGFLRMSNGDNVLIAPELKKGVKPNDWCLGQLFQRLNMPTRYFKGLYKMERHDLVSSHVNHHIKDQETHWKLRTRVIDENTILGRALLSAQYSVFDNSDLIRTMTEVFEHPSNSFKGNVWDDMNINVWYLIDRVLHLRLTFDSLTTKVGKTVNDEDDIVKVGVHISNSEVGYSSVKIEPLIYRQVCDNGLMARTRNGESGLNQRHIHLDEDEMYGRVAKAFSRAIRAGDKVLDHIRVAQREKVDNPFDVIEDIAEDRKYSEEFTDEIKTSWSQEPDETLYGVVNAFTRAAKTLETDRQVDVEREAGKILLGVA